jgi:hypothetical protein
MADAEAIRRKRELLAAELYAYFWHTNKELTARWTEAMLRLSPAGLRDLAVELRELETVTDQTNLELEAAHRAAAEGCEPTESLLDRALASIEHLSEIAEAMTRRLDGLLKT